MPPGPLESWLLPVMQVWPARLKSPPPIACFAARSVPSPGRRTNSVRVCGEQGEKFVDRPRLTRSARIPVSRVCGTCGAYPQNIDVAALTPFPLLAIADLETMDLDMAAMEKGYNRQVLKDFGRK